MNNNSNPISNVSMLTVNNRVNNKFFQSATIPLKTQTFEFLPLNSMPSPWTSPFQKSFISLFWTPCYSSSFFFFLLFFFNCSGFVRLSNVVNHDSPILVTAVRFLPDRLELVSSSELAESWLE